MIPTFRGRLEGEEAQHQIRVNIFRLSTTFFQTNACGPSVEPVTTALGSASEHFPILLFALVALSLLRAPAASVGYARSSVCIHRAAESEFPTIRRDEQSSPAE